MSVSLSTYLSHYLSIWNIFFSYLPVHLWSFYTDSWAQAFQVWTTKLRFYYLWLIYSLSLTYMMLRSVWSVKSAAILLALGVHCYFPVILSSILFNYVLSIQNCVSYRKHTVESWQLLVCFMVSLRQYFRLPLNSQQPSSQVLRLQVFAFVVQEVEPMLSR